MEHNFLHPRTGSFAQPAAENPTVIMVEAAYRHLGLDWRYLNVEVSPEHLGDAVRGARAMSWRGFNCSIPHKVTVIQHLDGLGASAEIIGAVNTVVRRADALIGENTDGKGFVKALEEIASASNKSIVLFGAGGAARAVAVELALAGAKKITVVNRGKKRGEDLANLLIHRMKADASFHCWEKTYSLPSDTDIVINATSIGLYPAVSASLDINLESLSSDMVVADGIPNPPLTQLLRSAESRGCRIADGLGMLVNQGIIAIKDWTGLDADASVMRQALLDLKL